MDKNKYIYIIISKNTYYQIKNYIFEIPREKYEFNNSYIERVNFVLDYMDKFNTYDELKNNLNNAILLSKMFINEKKLKCKY